jgi:hypothetical protein
MDRIIRANRNGETSGERNAKAGQEIAELASWLMNHDNIQ